MGFTMLSEGKLAIYATRVCAELQAPEELLDDASRAVYESMPRESIRENQSAIAETLFYLQMACVHNDQAKFDESVARLKELGAYEVLDYLAAQINIVRPRIIRALGSYEDMCKSSDDYSYVRPVFTPDNDDDLEIPSFLKKRGQ